MSHPVWSAYPLPLGELPCNFDYESVSEISGTEAFNTGIDRRDVYEGRVVCIVCGIDIDMILDYCHLIPECEPETVRASDSCVLAVSTSCVVAIDEREKLGPVQCQVPFPRVS